MLIFSSISRFFSKRKGLRGFTLVELIVVSAIIVIITAFVVFQQTRFNSSTLLRSLTYSLALSVRQAQIYGTSVRESAAGTNVFASGYGVYFSPGIFNEYKLFADLPAGSTPGDGQFVVQETLSTFKLGQGFTIAKFCATLAGGSTQHCSLGTTPAINTLSIYFRRPNPDACFSSDQAPGGCGLSAAPVYSSAYIQLVSSGNGDTRSVKISNTGQISVCLPNVTDLSTC